jgi:NADH:ubiquinone oxidoreductase subunit
LLNSIGTRIYLFFCAKRIGQDNFGNLYYQAKKDYNSLGQLKRFVFYKGKKEATKVPPIYNSWLRHVINDFPKNIELYKWQKTYQCNLTGTKEAYFPGYNKKESSLKKQYIAWAPSNN